MTFWADQFVEVTYRARQFALAWEENLAVRQHNLRPFYEAQLALARMNLECAAAIYRAKLNQETAS